MAWGAAFVLLALAAAAAAALRPVSFAPFATVAHCSSGASQCIGGSQAGDACLIAPDCPGGTCLGTCLDAPVDAAAGDFDHDGNLDVAIADSGSNDVVVLSGDGQGGLAVTAVLPAAIEPSAVAAGNLNGDAFTDLVVAKNVTNAIGVFLSNGDRTFRPEVEYAMGTAPEGVVLADFDGNGTLDVATADYASDTISVRLGKGDGTFGDLKQTSVPGGPWGLAAGTLDAGAALDLAVTLNDNALLAPLLGNGDGTFRYAGTAAAIAVEDSPVRVVLADFNRDGKVDAAVAAESADDFGLDVLLGNGDGTFQPQVTYAVGSYAESVVAADFNGDGVVDLATADGLGTDTLENEVSVLVGHGDGTFAVAQHFQTDGNTDAADQPIDGEPWGIAAVDLNGDGHPEIVTANYGATNDRVSILKNTSVPACVGDCDDNGTVSINELITGVGIALGQTPLSACRAFDSSGNGTVEVAELVAAVNNALNGCPTG